jgi:translocation and assembly module TamB
VEVEGSGDPAGEGEADRLRLVLNAPALAALTPLAALHPALARWTPQQGSAEVSLSTQGRWPALRTEGQARLRELRAAELGLASGQVSWRVSSGRDEPVSLQAELLQARVGVLRASVLRASVDGTLRAHRLSLDAAAPLQPPPGLERSFGLQPAAGTQARLQGSGGWDGARAGGGTWRGSLDRLSVGVWDGSTERRATPDASWLDARELSGEVRFAEDWAVAAVQAAAGRATLAGGVPLRWDEVRYRAHAGHPDLELRAEIAPVPVLPFLLRARTGLRWAGDLRMAARVDVRAGERLQADIALQRHDGDLQVLESGATPQPLGLSDRAARAERARGRVALHATARRQPPRADLGVGERAHTPAAALAGARRGARRHGEPAGAQPGRVGRLGAAGLAHRRGALHGGARGRAVRRAAAQRRAARQPRGGAQPAAGRGLQRRRARRDAQRRHRARGALQPARRRGHALRRGHGELGRLVELLLGPAQRAGAQLPRHRAGGPPARGQRRGHAADAQRAAARRRPPCGGQRAAGPLPAQRPTLDEDVSVLRPGVQAQEQVQPVQQSALLRTARIALDLDLGEKLRLRFFGVDTGLRQLRVSTPGGRLSVQGAVRAEDGTYTGYGQKSGDRARAGDACRAAGVGAAGHPGAAAEDRRPRGRGHHRARARPARQALQRAGHVGDRQAFTWLVLGRAPEGLGRADTEVLARAASALLAGQGEGPTDVLLRAVGLDDLSVRQSDGDTRDTIIRLGKQLSRRWYVGYERGVNATAGTFQLIYRIAQQFTLRAQSGLEKSSRPHLDLALRRILHAAARPPPRRPVRPATP